MSAATRLDNAVAWAIVAATFFIWHRFGLVPALVELGICVAVVQVVWRASR